MKICLLLSAHFIADFMLQSTDMANMKLHNHKLFLKHCFIYSVAITAVVVFYGSILQIILFALFISLSHLIIDAIRIREQKRHIYIEKREFRNFLIDQTVHLIILVIAAFLMPEKNYFGQVVSDLYYTCFTPNLFTVVVITTAYIACLHPAGVFIKKIFLRLGFQKFDNAEENASGFLIGILERSCILTLAILGQFTAISFVIAAKSLARIKLLEEKDFAEKYLVGTLISLFIALISGIIVQKTLGI